MPKKAYIVEFSVATRVVVDVPEDKMDNTPRDDDELFALVAEAAQEKTTREPRQYLNAENIVTAREDFACPAGETEIVP